MELFGLLIAKASSVFTKVWIVLSEGRGGEGQAVKFLRGVGRSCLVFLKVKVCYEGSGRWIT